VFDPDSAAAGIATAARACLAPDGQRTDIGLSVRFGTRDGTIDRVYFAPNDPHRAVARQCFSDALTGIAANVAPERWTFVDSLIRLGPDGDHTRSKIR
jgi:hypothetical protein